MSKFQKIIDSFQVKDSLNPKIWEKPEDPKESEMKPKVLKALEKISEKFVDYLGDDVFVEDVILTGSLSNFNWSEFSDFDLHIVIDYKEYGKNSDLYKELFDLKKIVFNNNHDIKIFGYDVELYAQDKEESHYASGVYSIMNKEWVKIPKKDKFDLDKKVLSEKIESWVNKIEKAIETSDKEDDLEILEKVKDKLKEYRKSGLEKDGELSYENLVFKFLRRSGHIEKLFDMKNKVEDKELSVERIVKEDVDKIDPQEAVAQSKFLTDLMKLVDQNISFELTPGIKPEKDENLKKVQSALQFGGFLLPEFGIDGKFGPETEDAVKKFQEKYQLDSTGKMEVDDLKHLIALLITKKFKDSDLGNINTMVKSALSAVKGKYNTPSNFRDVVEIITNELEGGYYHPIMKQQNPSRFSVMGDSGETMFGMDRKHGAKEETDVSAAKEFWSIIDSFDAKNNWEYGYELEDKPDVRNRLLNLVAEIMRPLFEKMANTYLSDEAKQIVMNDPKLYLNFAYGAYNGYGWFKGFAEKFNKKVEGGERDIEALRDYALKIRKESSHSLIRRSGEKIERIFDSIP